MEEPSRLVSLAEVKNILKKVEKEREDLSYGQRIALEHANKFARMTVKKTNDMIKELVKIESIEKNHAFKIADVLPRTKDDIKAIFAKERVTLSDNTIKSILDIVNKYYTE